MEDRLEVILASNERLTRLSVDSIGSHGRQIPFVSANVALCAANINVASWHGRVRFSQSWLVRRTNDDTSI